MICQEEAVEKPPTPSTLALPATPASTVVYSAAKKKLRLHSPMDEGIKKNLFTSPEKTDDPTGDDEPSDIDLSKAQVYGPDSNPQAVI